jgi:uncharacterized protein (TIGR02117 family)
MLKMTIRWFLRMLIAFIAFVLVWLLSAWLLPKFHSNNSFKESPGGVTILVKSNGVHTDILVPVKNGIKDWRKVLSPETYEEADSTFQYLAFGWGDKGFYLYTPTWADLKFSTAFKAAFFMGTTAMHVTYYKRMPEESERCRKLSVSEEQYKTLVAYIHSSFQLKNNSYIRIDHPGYGSDDNFYEANGTYSFLKTCNCWTGSALKDAGVRVGVWTPSAGGVLNSLP